MSPSRAFTEEDDQRIAFLWKQGKSGGDIAMELGRSRCAIQGRIYRMRRSMTDAPEPRAGMIKAPSPLVQRKQWKAKTQPKEPKPVKAKATKPEKPVAANLSNLEKRMHHKLATPPPLPPVLSLFEGPGLPFDRQAPKSCWQALNDAAIGETHLFCTRAATTGQFCEAHAARAYTKWERAA